MEINHFAMPIDVPSYGYGHEQSLADRITAFKAKVGVAILAGIALLSLSACSEQNDSYGGEKLVKVVFEVDDDKDIHNAIIDSMQNKLDPEVRVNYIKGARLERSSGGYMREPLVFMHVDTGAHIFAGEKAGADNGDMAILPAGPGITLCQTDPNIIPSKEEVHLGMDTTGKFLADVAMLINGNPGDEPCLPVELEDILSGKVRTTSTVRETTSTSSTTSTSTSTTSTTVARTSTTSTTRSPNRSTTSLAPVRTNTTAPRTTPSTAPRSTTTPNPPIVVTLPPDVTLP